MGRAGSDLKVNMQGLRGTTINSLSVFPRGGRSNHFGVSWNWVVRAFIVSCSTGLLLDLPANRAARLHPTEALHYE